MDLNAATFTRLDASDAAREPGFASLERSAGKPAELSEALKDFEALFVNQLLQLMRRSVPQGDASLSSPGGKLYRQMLDEEMSRLIAHSGKGLGLADMLQRQLGKEVLHEQP